MEKEFEVTGTTQDFITKFDAIAKALADEGKISHDRRTKDKGSRTEAFAYCVEMLHEQFIGRKEATAEKKRNAPVNVERARQASAKVEEAKEGIKKLCAISAKVDKKHKFYITPNFIKKQLGLGHARVAKKALEDQEIAKLVEETNKKQLGFPSFLHGEPSPKSSQFELFQKAKSHNLRFRSKAFKVNEQGQLLFIVEAMQSISDNIPTTKVLLDESFLENTLEQQAIAVIQNPNILRMLPYRYRIVGARNYRYIKDKTAKERPSLYNVVKKTALLSDSNNSISPISEDLLLPNSSGVLNGRIKGHYIYFLVCGEEVVYIGYSYNINRIKAHTSCKSFTKVYYVLYDDHSPSVESFLIQRFKTKYNRCYIAQKMGYHKIN